MKKTYIKLICSVISLIIVFMICSCTSISPKECTTHRGSLQCNKCALDYFGALSATIKENATEVKDGYYDIKANTDDLQTIVRYDEKENKVLCYLIYDNDGSNVIFLLNMKENTSFIYGWTLSVGGKMMGGTFKAKDLTDLVFRPEIEYNEFNEEERALLDGYYEESVSFAVDMIHSVLVNNENNLTISNLGFENYTPNV